MDNKLKQTLPQINKLYRYVEDEILDIIDDFKIDNINELASERLKRKVEKIVKESDNNSLFYLYTKNLLKKLTNGNALEILIYSFYYNIENKLEELSNIVFEFCKEDALNEIEKDSGIKGKIGKRTFETFLVIASINKPYRNYLSDLSFLDYRETYTQVITSIRGEEINESVYDRLITKQRNRILNINEDKHSGVLHDTAVQVENASYVEPLKEKNEKVIFYNPMDNRTTTMCESLYNQVFNTNDWNEFDRDMGNGEMKHFRIFGLEIGINQPPILPVHHCRSSLIYTKT